jgi:hypothetical protein
VGKGRASDLVLAEQEKKNPRRHTDESDGAK